MNGPREHYDKQNNQRKTGICALSCMCNWKSLNSYKQSRMIVFGAGGGENGEMVVRLQTSS